MIEIVPTILAESQREFEEKLRAVEKQAKIVHVDIMDGTLVPFTNWFDARAVGAMETPVQFEMHLMVSNPLPIIAQWAAAVPHLFRAIFHAELERPLNKIAESIRQDFRLEAGLALNPETPLDEIHAVLGDIQLLLFLGVHPGRSGQTFEGDYILEKIREARLRAPRLAMGVDGGITPENLPDFVQAGVSHVCTGSAVFASERPAESIEKLQKEAEKMSGSTA